MKIKLLDSNNNFITFIANNWVYIFFLLYVIIYNYLYLQQGYAAHMDEGYIQSLAQRMLDGDILYVDFYYLRPPLTIYIQLVLMYIFGDAYTIFAARIFLMLQMTFLVILISRIYYKHVKPLELLFLLIVSFTITTLLLTFPWYSYDGLFFSGIGIYFITNKKYYFAGASFLLACMAKQNFILFLPLFIILIFALQWYLRDKSLFSVKYVLQIILGFIVSGLLFFLLMVSTSSLSGVINNLFTLPLVSSGLGFKFALFQNTFAALQISLPLVIATSILYYYKFRDKRGILLLSIFFVIFGFNYFLDLPQFIYYMIFFNYLILLILLPLSKEIYKSATHFKFIIGWIGFVIIQYLSGFNYGGLFFAYMGAGVALPFSYVAIKKYHLNFNIKIVSVIIFIAFLFLGFHHKYYYVYHDLPRNQMGYQFKAPKLKGVESALKTVNLVDFLYETINTYSDKGDYILIYPDYPAIYYLTDRKNPSPVGWHYKLFGKMLDESLDAIEEKLPKLIILNNEDIPKRLSSLLENHYTEKNTDNYLKLFIYDK